MVELRFGYGHQMMRLLIIKRSILEYNMSAIVGRLLINQQYYAFHINLITDTLVYN